MLHLARRKSREPSRYPSLHPLQVLRNSRHVPQYAPQQPIFPVSPMDPAPFDDTLPCRRQKQSNRAPFPAKRCRDTRSRVIVPRARKKKESVKPDDFTDFWCDRRDLNPYPYRTRPSNVRVCQFRHDRALLFRNDRYYIGFGGVCQDGFPLFLKSVGKGPFRMAACSSGRHSSAECPSGKEAERS